MRKSLLVDGICGSLILLFLYTALSKLFHYRQFSVTLSTSPLISSYSNMIAWALPLIEIAVSLLLFIPSTKRKGLLASLVVLTLFTIYLINMLLFTKDLPCSCGGVISQMTWKQHIFFNLFFIGLSIAGLQLNREFPRGWGGHLPYPTRNDVL